MSCKSNTREYREGDSLFVNQKQVLGDTVPPNKGNVQDSLYTMIESISEVKLLAKKSIKSSSEKKVNIYISKQPSEGDNYFWVEVGLSDSIRFQPVYNFRVDPVTFEIKYYDTETDSIVTLSKWRKTRGW
jgi:hypothetical protein